MKLFVRVALGAVGVLVVGLVGLSIAARFADGPIAMFAGGPFTNGELIGGSEPDWSFVHDVQEVEFQLLDPPRSRTTWILEHEGRIYIPSGYMNTTWGKLWKQWPIEAMKDGRTILRVDGKLYERELVRIEAGPLVSPLVAELGRKYVGGSEIDPEHVATGNLWLFELAPRR